jgi:hypothetical protein
MNADAIATYITSTFPDTTTTTAMGATFFFNDPTKMFPFATIVTSDEHDQASDLNRQGVFRLNIGVGKETFQSIAGEESAHDFKALDRLMPHPVYGQMYWLCVLNPSDGTFERVKGLLKEAYEVSAKRYVK